MANFKKAKKYHFTYKTTCLLNNKYYIGMHSTNELDDRYIGSGKRLWYSVRKYGKENFKFEILEFLPDRESLAKREKELVNEDTLRDSNCLNLKLGGFGGFSSEAHRKKAQAAGGKKVRQILSAKHSERLKSDFDYREKWLKSLKGNQSWLGKKHTDETRSKIKLSMKGKGVGNTNSQFNTCWITDGLKNKKIKKEELNNFLLLGWKLGRIFL